MVSDLITELEIIIEQLREAQAESVEDAISTLDQVAAELRKQAEAAEQGASKLSDAREVLS